MNYLKTLAVASLAALVGTAAVADGFTPVVAAPEPVVIVEPAAAQPTAEQILVPLVLMGAVLALGIHLESREDTSEE